MKQAYLGIICFLIVISIIFNYSSDFDYSYDGLEYGVDFDTPSNINAAKIQGSFDTVIKYSSYVTDFLSDTVSDIFSTFSDDINTGDIVFDSFYDDLHQRAEAYIENNKPFGTRWYYKNNLWVLTNCLRGYMKVIWFDIPNSGYSHDISDCMSHFGWTDKEVLYIHEFMMENDIKHYYNGESFGWSGYSS